MPFSSGTYSLYATGNPAVTDTTISSTWANNTLNDIATALSTCLLKDGTQTATASIGFAQGIDVTTAATTPSTTFACFNTTATTVNAFGAASVALNIGHASAAAAFAGGISIPTGKSVTGAGTAAISGFALIGATMFNGPIGGAGATPAAATVTTLSASGTISNTHATSAEFKSTNNNAATYFGNNTAGAYMQVYGSTHATKANQIDLVAAGGINVNGLPTSSAGLVSGDVWLNSNVFTIVP